MKEEKQLAIIRLRHLLNTAAMCGDTACISPGQIADACKIRDEMRQRNEKRQTLELIVVESSGALLKLPPASPPHHYQENGPLPALEQPSSPKQRDQEFSQSLCALSMSPQ